MEIYRLNQDLVSLVKVWTSLQELQLSPTQDIVNCLLKGARDFGHERTARAILQLVQQDMTTLPLNSASYSALLTMAARFGWESDVQSILIDMVNAGFKPTTSLYQGIINSLRVDGGDKSERIRDFMEELFPEAIVEEDMSINEQAQLLQENISRAD